MRIRIFLLFAILGAVMAPCLRSQTGNISSWTDTFLRQHVQFNLVDYTAINKDPRTLDGLVDALAQVDPANLEGKSAELAFWLNAYNILVIKSVVEAYPIKSPTEVAGFFDLRKHTIAGQSLTLNEIENEEVRARFGDARIHFALVCAAKGCPPLAEEAFSADKLDGQLDARTRAALNDPRHVRVDAGAGKVYVSELFKWYRDDFTAEAKTIIGFINRYRPEPIPTNYRVDYITYDWSLNERRSEPQGSFLIEPENLQAYTPSILLSPGQLELKQFNNLYTQTAYFDHRGERIEQNARSTYFTGITNVLYGITRRVNVGVDLYFKSVRIDGAGSSPFSVFDFSTGPNARTALASVAPRVKFAPFRGVSSISIQTALVVPLAPDLEGGAGSPFLDYDDVQWWTQIFYDRWLGQYLLIYTETGAFIRLDANAGAFTTPIKVILNYYPSSRWTLYLPADLAPTWDGFGWSSYFSQFGLGAKYQLTRTLELETLYTRFPLGKNGGAGETFNLGIRFIR